MDFGILKTASSKMDAQKSCASTEDMMKGRQLPRGGL